LTAEVYFTNAMPRPYDVAFRARAVAAYERGEGGSHELADLFGIGYRTLERWVAQYRRTDSVAPRPRGGGWRSPINVVVLRAVVREDPDGTSDELCRAYNARVPRAERTNPTSVRRRLRREGFVLKKNGSGRANTTGRMSAPNATRSGPRSDASTHGGSSRSMKPE
jgi:transposase